MEHGIYNQNLQAVPPTGSISYINNSTSSIHPVPAKIEIRKEGKLGRVYYPAPYMTNDNLDYYQDAYEIGYEKIIDTYAAARSMSTRACRLTLFFKDTVTTRDVNKAQIYAWRKGIKTLYYIRLRQLALKAPNGRLRLLLLSNIEAASSRVPAPTEPGLRRLNRKRTKIPSGEAASRTVA